MTNRLLWSGALASVILLGMQIAADAGEHGKPCPYKAKQQAHQMEQRKWAECKADIARMGDKMMAKHNAGDMSAEEAAAFKANWAKMKQAKMKQCQAEIQHMKKKAYQAHQNQKGNN